MSSSLLTRAALTDLICARLESYQAQLKAHFDASTRQVGVRHAIVDDLERPLLRQLARVDDGLRRGLGKKDVYEGSKP